MICQSPESTAHLLNALFHAVTDGVLVLDHESRIIDCNPAFYQRLGYEKHELIDLLITSLEIAKPTHMVLDWRARVSPSGETTFETAYRRKDGTVMMAELDVRHIEVEDKILYMAIVRDITHRYQMEESLKEGLEVYRAAINTPAMGFWTVDMEGRFIEVNDAYEKLSGYSRDELLCMGIMDVEAIEDPELINAHIEKVMQTGFDRFRSKHIRKDGTLWPVEVVTSYSEIQGGRFFVFIEDITEKVAQENHLKLASRVFETMAQAVVITDSANRIVSINPAFTRITGFCLNEVLGKNPWKFTSTRHDQAFYETVQDSLNTNGQWEGEIWSRRKDDMVYAKWLTIKAIYDLHGKIYQYVSIFSDITERKKSEELIWRQANFDLLTGLPNRYLLYNHLEREIKKAQRGGWPLAVLFIDLDHFKEVNDSLGHTKGDTLLVQVAQRISACVRDTDSIARLGGDEFTVVLPDFGNQSNLERIVRSLIHELSQPYNLGDEELAVVTASIGITLYPDDSDNLHDLLKHSDRAMYVAKAEGRNRFSYFTRSIQEEKQEKMKLANDLR